MSCREFLSFFLAAVAVIVFDVVVLTVIVRLATGHWLVTL